MGCWSHSNKWCQWFYVRSPFRKIRGLDVHCIQNFTSGVTTLSMQVRYSALRFEPWETFDSVHVESNGGVPQLFLPEVNNQRLGLAKMVRKIVVLAPLIQISDVIRCKHLTICHFCGTRSYWSAWYGLLSQ